MAVQGKELVASPGGQLYVVSRTRDGEYHVYAVQTTYIQTFHRKHEALRAIARNTLDKEQ